MINLVHIINGPNLNLLGTRQPEIYGNTTLNDVEARCSNLAKNFSLNLKFSQSNHEGEIVDTIQNANGLVAGIIINPGAFSHTSVAILDALNVFEGVVLEVHISNIHRREEFRHKSYVSLRADGVICGFGVRGYEIAVEHMNELLQ
ncbi:MAG: type II 3-dehydroquinate dehydratase [Paracoccaceae bacterium]|jgi:3-dehydroquinate dehydratase-2|nr:type II 3-dehydroquinate dehydratase [Paracoccaceae bacterium]|tara:strand:+ start:519 stop:956 length:438 start_codon:yes stop_codon:yes gene_type:complete